MKITVNGHTEELDDLSARRITVFLKDHIPKTYGITYKAAEIVIHDRPRPGLEKLKESGYLHFFAVRKGT